MNCANPVPVFTQSRYINATHFPKMLSYFACGKCENCLNILKTEWQIRAYYEAKRCLDHKGFLYFDCLTYSDSTIPRISYHVPSGLVMEFDNYAFARDHVRHFRVRLRRRLEYLGYPVSNENLKIFVGSEFATDPRHTQRSHYHILFYVNLDIDPIAFSMIIDECWKYGRTDGVTYKGVGYVLGHNTISSLDDHAVKASNYVSKYVLKEIGISNKITYKVRSLFDKYIYPDDSDWLAKPTKRMAYKRILRDCLPFHVQSQNFGDYAIDLYRDMMLDYMQIPCVTKDGILNFGLPSYYRKKLFYDVQWFNGTKRFVPNSYYFTYKVKNLNRLIKSDKLNFQDLVDNGKKLGFPMIVPDNYDFTNLALYQRVYRGRYLADMEIDPLLMLDNSQYDIKSAFSLKLPIFYGYQTYRDLIDYGLRHFSHEYHGSKFLRARNMKFSIIHNEEIENNCCFIPEYENILDALNSVQSYLNAVKASQRFVKRVNQEYYKQLGILW